MKPSALRCAALSATFALAHGSTALATDKADCAAALKLAQADKGAGKLNKALTELATCSRPVCPKAMVKQCTDLTTALTAAQPTVLFTAKDASGNPVALVTVTVDGSIVSSNLDGTPVALDAGPHTMKFESDGATPVEKQITVEAGTKSQPVAIDLDVNPPKPAAAAVATAAAAAKKDDDGPGSMWDTTEDPLKRYYFIGLRYRGDVIPQFMINIFVNGGGTVFSNAITLEADLRKDRFSLIPGITYASYGTGNLLFEQKNQDPTLAGNWSMVNSSLSAIYLSAELLWSVKIANHWDFEYGAEFGLGFIFGNLEDNWVSATTGTQVSPSNYTVCQAVGPIGSGCNPADHQNSQPPKVGGYNEPSWANGGSKPNIFPMVNFPQVGLRYKPMKQLETRLGIGFSLTGFYFGISADYGLETLLDNKPSELPPGEKAPDKPADRPTEKPAE